MESLALAFSSGWASGINSYLVVLVLGIADRAGNLDEIPDVLGRWEVLAVAAVLYAFEFVADKIPYVDSVWDFISTVIRPVAGGVVGVLIAGDSSSLNELAGGAVGGGSALASHTVKAGTRLAVNTVPEPFTNIGISVGEDVAVLAVVWFAVEHPVAAGSIALTLLIVGLVLLWLAWRTIRRISPKRPISAWTRSPTGRWRASSPASSSPHRRATGWPRCASPRRSASPTASPSARSCRCSTAATAARVGVDFEDFKKGAAAAIPVQRVDLRRAELLPTHGNLTRTPAGKNSTARLRSMRRKSRNPSL